MAEGIGIPVIVSPFGAKLMAALNAEAARLLLEVSTGGGGGGGSGGGVPAGGAGGDFLKKRTATDQDVEWSPVVDAGYF
jgi:hypothetical protein